MEIALVFAFNVHLSCGGGFKCHVSGILNVETRLVQRFWLSVYIFVLVPHDVISSVYTAFSVRRLCDNIDIYLDG
jgi:hypothetical protein